MRITRNERLVVTGSPLCQRLAVDPPKSFSMTRDGELKREDVFWFILISNFSLVLE